MSTVAHLDAARQAVLDVLRDGQRFVVVTHEHPDGDAIGSLVAATRGLRSIGKDVVAMVAPTDLPLAREYDFVATIELECTPPADVADRIALCLDCGNRDRMIVPSLFGASGPVINVDHHHDNTNFGDINLIDATASSTVEILWSLFRELDVPLDRQTADALYVGLVTDTGRFMYQNTRSDSHRMAADLLAAGVEPFPVYRTLYEGVPLSKLALLGRALERVHSDDEHRLVFSYLRRCDFEDTQASNSEAEGIIDQLRTVIGTRIAVLAREIETTDGVRTKVSLRSSSDQIDVSAIARAGGGGGHPQAAGFNTRFGEDELLAFLRDQLQPPG